MRLLQPADYPFILRIETSDRRLATYRHRGITPSPESFVHGLWAGVFAQFLVVMRIDNTPIGVVAGYGADYRNGFARVAAVCDPMYEKRGWPVEGWHLFLDYVFASMPLRKLYADVLEFNASLFSAGLLKDFEVEGRLTKHEYLDGQYWDLFVLGLTRDRWSSRAERSLASRIRVAETARSQG